MATYKNLYILITSRIETSLYALRDLVHNEHIYKSEEDAKNALTHIVEKTDSIDFVDMIDLSIPQEANETYLLYHFSDNYCDEYIHFNKKEDAQDKFYELCREQDNSIKCDDVIRMTTKSDEEIYNKTTSTIYEVDVFDKYSRLCYPNNGNRWVMIGFDNL
jgi:hypothetical protein